MADSVILPLILTLSAALASAAVTLVVILAIRHHRRHSKKAPSASGSSNSDRSSMGIIASSALAAKGSTASPSGSLQISQSSPDLVCGDDSSTGDGRLIGNKSLGQTIRQLNKARHKTPSKSPIVKQATMPSEPQRHLDFQRRLAPRIDWSKIMEFTIHGVRHREQPTASSPANQFQPELYRHDSAAGENSSGSSQLALDSPQPTSGPDASANSAGRLDFSVAYDQTSELLAVNLIRAKLLQAKNFFGTSDPYVRVCLLPDRKKKFQTKVHRKTQSPQFDEEFTFVVSRGELGRRTLQLSVYDFDRFSRHQLVGVVLVNDIGINFDLSRKQNFELDILRYKQETEDLGELLLTLCYLPTAGRLTVTVMKARNLKASDPSGKADPYVKVALICRGRQFKKKTTVKKNTLNPVYNEVIVFDVPQANVEEVSLLIKVADYNRVGSNEPVGCCAIGPKCVGTGRDHFFEMLENARKPVAQWYTLRESV